MNNNTNKTTAMKKMSQWMSQWIPVLFLYVVGFSFMITLFYRGQELVDARWGMPGMAMIGMYAMGGVLSIFTFLIVAPYVRDLYYSILSARHQAIRVTGVYDFVDAATCMEEVRNIVLDQGNSIEDVIRKIKALDGKSFRDITGVVCDEEIIGIADGVHLTVTVTKPATLKAFKKLPKETRKYVDIVYVPEE
jgi:hypothetical protein